MPGQLIPPSTTAAAQPDLSEPDLSQRVATLEAAVLTGAEGPQQAQLGFAYKHTQEAPATVWDVHHDLGYDPAAFLVVDLAGDRWWPRRIEFIEPGQTVRLTFTQSIAGTAHTS
jgi:hypothetical protein